jgi:hypothetical protein
MLGRRALEHSKLSRIERAKAVKATRATTFEGGRRVHYFNCFGVEVVAAEKLIENKGLLQRCMVIEMVKGYPEKYHYVSTQILTRYFPSGVGLGFLKLILM